MFSIIIAFAVFSTIYTQMKRFWFRLTLLIILSAALIAGFFGASTRTDVLAQESTPGSDDVFITVTNPDQINVRNGPDTSLYEIIGHMQPGETAQALGVSPGRDWIQIAFPAGPRGVAWVFAPLVSVSSGNLRVIEPPPIPPTVTITIDPTLAAAYVFEPTVTRMPTFTPPPPLELPQFTQTTVGNKNTNIPMGVIVLGLGIPGVLGYLISYLRRR
jgi:hypothetical protein